MDLKNSNSFDSIDSPLEIPKYKPDSPLSCRVKDTETIDEVFEEENLEEEDLKEENLEKENLKKDKENITKKLIKAEKVNIDIHGFNKRKSIKEIQDCDTKHKLKDYINEKKRKLDQSKRILELKYASYKKCNDFWNIGTIILSSLLTFIESTKLIFITDESPQIVEELFALTPIFLGTFITCSASILKFKKYQEKMESLYIVIDKCIIMIAKLKNKREEIKLLSDCGEEFHKIKNDYVTNICKEYSDVYQGTERYITNQDYDIYLKLINQSDYNKHMIEHDKNEFFKKYHHELDIDKIISKIEVKKERCCV